MPRSEPEPSSPNPEHSPTASELTSQIHLRLLEDLRASELRYRTLVEHVPAVVFRLDASQRIEFASLALMDVLGRNPADATGHAFREYLHKDERKVLEFPRNINDIEDSFLFAHADGRPISVRVTAHRDEHAGWTGVLTDQTRIHALEGQLRQAQKMEAIGSLAGGVAHDFNNILMGILGLADSLVQGLPEGDPRRGDAADVMKLAERGSAITHKLLQISRKKEATPECVDLCQLSLGMRDVLRRLLPENIELLVQTPPHLVPVRADRTGLEQVLLNLVVNARDAMPWGGRVVVEVDTAPDGPVPVASVCVTDSGTGMPPEVIERIFEPFFSTKGKGGTGLGLSVVYGIVQQAGGTISVESVECQGTTFRILLPLVAMDPAPSTPLPAASTQGAPRIILLVDDDTTLLRIMRAGLERGGHTVLESTCVRGALDQIDEHTEIDLIITDLGLGDASGNELVAALRTRHLSTPVLIVTGEGDDGAPLQAPVHAVLAKPLRIPELVAAVAATPRKP